jgi:predicted NBD/HSP70 family sugar kinase
MNYVTLMDPELIVIGGGMAAAGDDLIDEARLGSWQV